MADSAASRAVTRVEAFDRRNDMGPGHDQIAARIMRPEFIDRPWPQHFLGQGLVLGAGERAGRTIGGGGARLLEHGDAGILPLIAALAARLPVAFIADLGDDPGDAFLMTELGVGLAVEFVAMDDSQLALRHAALDPGDAAPGHGGRLFFAEVLSHQGREPAFR